MKKIAKVNWVRVFNVVYLTFVLITCIVGQFVPACKPTSTTIVCAVIIGIFWIVDEIMELRRQVEISNSLAKWLMEHQESNKGDKYVSKS